MPYPSLEQQADVERCLCLLEAEKAGARHPIRTIPLDMVAEAVYRQALGPTWHGFIIVVPEYVLMHALRVVCDRYDPPRNPPPQPPSTEFIPGGSDMMATRYEPQA